MPETLTPETETQLLELARWALAEKQTLAIEGFGTKAGFGYASTANRRVSLRAVTGIVDYEPSELVMTARAGTPLHEVESALADHGQCLAFEPPDLGALFGTAGGGGSIGGVFLGNLSGPRRFTAGAARDHILGVRALSGRAEIWKSGGRVIKNVTGYDLSKLLAGSWGTLSFAMELTFKVLPAPAYSVSLALGGLAAAGGVELLARLAQSRLECSGLAYIPGRLLSSLEIAHQGDDDRGVALVRLEGSRVSVEARHRDLLHLLPPGEPPHALEGEASRRVWTGIRDVRPLAVDPGNAVIAKLSLPPAAAGETAGMLSGKPGRAWYADGGGGWIWVGLGEAVAADTITVLRHRLRACGGSAVLYRAPETLKRAVGLYADWPEGLISLTHRIKHSFDPENILNPGRLFLH